MRQLLTLLIALFLVGPALAGPASALEAALQDAANLPEEQAYNTIYFHQPGGFFQFAVKRDKIAATYQQVAKFHFNQLQTFKDFGPVRVIALDLVAVDITYFGGWDKRKIEKLADVEPYFTERAVYAANEDYWRYYHDGATWKRGWYKEKAAKEIRVPVPAQWLDKAKAQTLVKITDNRLPLMRFDWFVSQTGISQDRVLGYYDFMGFKNRDDIQRQAGLDIKLAAKLDLIDQAYKRRSGVSVNNRGIERIAALPGPYWFTKDTNTNIKEQNVARFLNGDLKHDAEEIYFFLSNGLPGYGASNAAGVLQKKVPAGIAGNRNSRSNDLEIDVPAGCIQCHVEVIRPFKCDARALYRDRIRLESPNPFIARHLQRQYLSDIDELIAEDQAKYAKAIKKCNGLTPAVNAEAFTEVLARYLYEDVTLEKLAVEMGSTVERLRAAIGRQIEGDQKNKGGLADPSLAGLWQNPPLPLRREELEELQGLLWRWMEFQP